MMFDADVYIEAGIIRQVGKDLQIPGRTKIIDAEGKMVMPGGIDPHTHFQMPFMGTTTVDDFYSGTKAALAGGTTMIIDFVIDPESSLLEAYEKWRGWADEKACCDYSLHVAVTSWKENTKQEMETLTTEKGINSFKVFMCYDKMQLTDKDLLQIFEACSVSGAIALVHAENGDIIKNNQKKLLAAGITGPDGHLYSRPDDVESEATHRAIILANSVLCPIYIVHVMSKHAADVVASLRQKGYIAYGEIISAALGIDGRNYLSEHFDHAAAHVSSPPLSPDPSTPSHLIKLLSCGALQVTGSDHCTFSTAQKALGSDDFTKIPNGVNGVEERMSILWENGVLTGLMDACRFVAVTSTNAAKIFNLYPRKGRIQENSDADIVVWDPHAEKTLSAKSHHQNVNVNVFEGMQVRGVPIYVISQGRLVVSEGQIQVNQGSGRFIRTPAFCPHVFDCIEQRKMRSAIHIDDISQSVPDFLTDEFEECDVRDEYERTVKESTPVPKEEYIAPAKSSGKEFYSRPQTKSGRRNELDSTFSISGARIDDDDDEGTRPTIKVRQPPGGFSSGLW